MLIKTQFIIVGKNLEVDYPEHIIQDYDCNCSVYISYFYKKILEKGSLSTPFDKQEFRLEMEKTIMNYKK